ncbi:hypothetical protein LOD99_1264 [Oopsacas minuta]|uniref:Uncharacterized protein n=1 Tax=Oopsacas minuta TaxID=111878 RepID=A0AAV7K6W4_9METZ|nr:hypothetical protein LOD99_1264 [Oopsacas minuta]
MTLSNKQQEPAITPFINLQRLPYTDFITPTNPFATTTFLSDKDSQQSLASVHPHTIDYDTVIAPDQSIQPFNNEYQIEKVPSHYTVDVSKLEAEDVAEEDTFLPLTPSEFNTFEGYSVSKQLEIVSLPQSSVVSPSKPFQDSLTLENVEFRNDSTQFDIQRETSFEYINRFVAEVKKFMDKRNVKIRPNISEEETIPMPPCDTIITPELPDKMDEMITEIARQKLDELWDDYLQNISYFSNKPQLIRRNNKMQSADSTISGYNTKMTSSLSDTTLFTFQTHSKVARQTRRNHLVLKPRRKPVRRRTRELTNCVSNLATQTQIVETNHIPEDMLLSVKSNSVAFLVTGDEQKSSDCVGETVSPKNVSNTFSLQEACQSFKPGFIMNSSLRQIELQKRRMSRRELAQQLFMIPTANKHIQTHTQG